MKRRPVGNHNRGQQRRNAYRRRPVGKPMAVLLVAVVILAVCVLGLSVYKLLKIRSENQNRGRYWNGIEGNVFTGDADFTDTGFRFDFEELLALCSDGVGYIYQPGVMSYPIVQGEDNDTYLRYRMDGTYDVGGSIFVDARFEEGLEGQYSIVYGHNMKDGSMFGPLLNYENEDYYKEHPWFDIYIGDRHYRYYVFSSFIAEADGYVYTYSFENGDYADQFQRLREESFYETDVRELREEDHVIVLSTCVYTLDEAYRNVVCLVRGEEVEDVPENESWEDWE